MCKKSRISYKFAKTLSKGPAGKLFSIIYLSIYLANDFSTRLGKFQAGSIENRIKSSPVVNSILSEHLLTLELFLCKISSFSHINDARDLRNP